MAKRVFNFSAGPAMLPLEVLEEVQRDFVDFKGSGMSIIEMSHRSKGYDPVHAETKASIKRLLNLSDNYEVLFMTGGASTQFALMPMNFCPADKTADYINTGEWSKKAMKEAKIQGKKINVVASSEDKNFNYIPSEKTFKYTDGAAYVHMTSNNTIFGTQFRSFPKTTAPLFCDMSSDFMSRAFDANQFAFIYAGAQKNIGPAGVTLVILRKDLLARIPETLPTMFSYKTHVDGDSLYNTPPVFAIYIMGLVMKWMEKNGGIAAMEKKNVAKATILFDCLDKSGFYKPTVAREFRSHMNVTFRLPSEDLEKKFISEATAAGFDGLKGHRSVGGCRASIYNAFPKDGVEKLVDFMKAFEKKSS